MTSYPVNRMPRHFNPIPYHASLFAMSPPPPILTPDNFVPKYIIRYKNNSDLFKAEREVGAQGAGQGEKLCSRILGLFHRTGVWLLTVETRLESRATSCKVPRALFHRFYSDNHISAIVPHSPIPVRWGVQQAARYHTPSQYGKASLRLWHGAWLISFSQKLLSHTISLLNRWFYHTIYKNQIKVKLSL